MHSAHGWFAAAVIAVDRCRHAHQAARERALRLKVSSREALARLAATERLSEFPPAVVPAASEVRRIDEPEARARAVRIALLGLSTCSQERAPRASHSRPDSMS